MEDLRRIIREILKEELSAIKGKTNAENFPIKEEVVKIQSSSDLRLFQSNEPLTHISANSLLVTVSLVISSNLCLN